MNKTVFIHGRPAPHPIHTEYAKSVKADFQYVDFLLPWHENRSSKLKRYLSWLICSLFFPNRRSYSVFLSEGIHFPPVIMKLTGLLRKDQKTGVLLDDESVWFLYTGFYSRFTSFMMKSALKQYDFLIVTAPFQIKILHEMIPDLPTSKLIYNGVDDVRLQDLLQVEPDKGSKDIVFIGNGPSGWRGWYKGLDLTLKCFARIKEVEHDIRLHLVGDWDEPYLKELIRKYAKKVEDDILIYGRVKKISQVLKKGRVYLHPARGEAFGISVLEGMAAGLIPVVSTATGSNYIVAEADKNLVQPPDENKIVERVIAVLQMSGKEFSDLSVRCKKIAAQYPASRAIANFRKEFESAIKNDG